MGCAESREKPPKYQFDRDAELRIRSLYQSIVEQNDQKMQSEQFQELFQENPYLGRKIFKYAKMVNNEKDQVSQVNFLNLAGQLCHNTTMVYGNEKDRKFNKIDLLFIILNKMTYNEILKEELQEVNQDQSLVEVGYEQGLKFLNNVFKIFNYTSSSHDQINEQAARAVMDMIFREEFGQINYWRFMKLIKEQLMHLNIIIQKYFTNKFLRNSVKYHLPKLDMPSQLLNKDLVSLLFLSNSYLQSRNSMVKLYGSEAESYSFKDFSEKLINYAQPVLILIKSVIKSSSGDKSYIYGGFHTRFENKKAFQGSSETYIFSLFPKFQNFHAQKPYNFSGIQTQESQKFAYLYSPYFQQKGITLNSSSTLETPGLGFGHTVNDKFRIWIGEDIRESYTDHKGDCYKHGHLQDIQGEAQIQYIEAWGVENSLDRSNIKEQELFAKEAKVIYSYKEHSDKQQYPKDLASQSGISPKASFANVDDTTGDKNGQVNSVNDMNSPTVQTGSPVTQAPTYNYNPNRNSQTLSQSQTRSQGSRYKSGKEVQVTNQSSESVKVQQYSFNNQQLSSSQQRYQYNYSSSIQAQTNPSNN